MILSMLVACTFAQAQSTSPIDYAQGWSTVASAIRTSYYGRFTRQDELDRILSSSASAAKRSHSRVEFRAAINDMVAKLGDSHFHFATDEQQDYYLIDNISIADARPMPNIDAWFKPATDGYEISMLMEGGECDRAGLRKGDVITRLDNEPFTPIESLRGKKGQLVTLKGRRGADQWTKQVTVHEEIALAMFMRATKNSERIISYNGKKIAYFHLWTLCDPKFRTEMDQALSGSLGSADAVILDIRDGFGGWENGYTDRFFIPDIRVEWGPDHQRAGDDRPLALLINGGSVSAKEMLAYIIKKTKRGTLVGSRTPGRLIGAECARVGNWGWLEMPRDQVKIDGICLEKNGVSPDIEVAQEYDDKGKDLVVEAALKVLTKS